jgi:hypothetical protein
MARSPHTCAATSATGLSRRCGTRDSPELIGQQRSVLEVASVWQVGRCQPAVGISHRTTMVLRAEQGRRTHPALVHPKYLAENRQVPWWYGLNR